MKFPRRLPMKSSIVKRSVSIDGHKTSVALEDEFWNELKQIAAAQNTSAGKLVLKIEKEREHANLSSAIRLFVLDYYCKRAAADQQPKHPPARRRPSTTCACVSFTGSRLCVLPQ
jgi:predicted DNA-binding ribbon-helix-helix protein